MTLDDFLSLDEVHEISSESAQKLNHALSQASVGDIPEDKRGMVLDYLLCALNVGAVVPDIQPALDSLRISLEHSDLS